MVNCLLKSSVKLTPNVNLKSKCLHNNIQSYIPFDLKSDEFKDSRLSKFLTEEQELQSIKKMFQAKKIIDDNVKFLEKNIEMCKNCDYKDICY